MPNRILKDSICTSPNIDALSREAEVFFYRLLVQCDDYGRMDARPAILRAKCYPLQVDAVSQDDIKRWFAELVRAKLIIPYQADGGDYLQMRTWERHQQIRAKRSKYPDMKSSDINCNQMQSNVPVFENPIQSESESESNFASDDADLPFSDPPTPAPKKEKVKPAPKETNPAQREMFGAIRDTCELNGELHASRIGKTARELLAAGYTPEQVRGFKDWWLSDPWRAEHTPVPTIAKLIEKLEQFKNAADKPRPVFTNSTNGRGQSKVDRSLAAVDEVRQMLKQQEVH
jgi:hypothetical protein